MADLRALLQERGYDDVRTHLQSGNVVVATRQAPGKVARTIEQAVAERFGFDVDVIARSGDELAAIVAADPLGDVAGEGKWHFVVFWDAKPDVAKLRELVTDETLEANGREVYIWCPTGVQGSKLMNRLDGTFRNWNTVTKLLEMVEDDR